MSAKEQMRAMLDQLMGTRADETSRRSYSFDHPQICRPFLLGCCPHDILAGTRVDLGDCALIHDFALRSDYEAAQKERDYYFDIDAYEALDQFVRDCDRRTEYAKKKLKETQEELGEEAARKMNVIHELGEEIGTKLASAEELGAAGEVDKSMKLMDEVEALKKKKIDLETDFRNSMPASTYQQQKLRVCEVCSAYLGIHDNDRRLADHFGGKLHIGFIRIREKLDDLRKTAEQRRIQRDSDKEYQEYMEESMRKQRSALQPSSTPSKLPSAKRPLEEEHSRPTPVPRQSRPDSSRRRSDASDYSAARYGADDRSRRSLSRRRRGHRHHHRSRSRPSRNRDSRSRSRRCHYKRHSRHSSRRHHRHRRDSSDYSESDESSRQSWSKRRRSQSSSSDSTETSRRKSKSASKENGEI